MTLLKVEAIGDTFAQLGGEWFDSARVALHASGAHRIWAFAAEDEAAAQALADMLPRGAGERVIGLIPGSHPGWGDEGRAACLRLAGCAADYAGVAGLLMAVDAPDCARCPGHAAGCEGCDSPA